MFLSVLALAEFDKGIHNLEPDHPDRSRYMAARDALAHRFSDRLLSVDDAIVFRWGVISGDVKRRTRQAPPVIDTFLAATAIEPDLRSEERRDGKECVRTCRSRWSPCH